MKQHLLLYPLLTLALLVAATMSLGSCSDDESPLHIEPVRTGLSVSLTVSGEQPVYPSNDTTATRAATTMAGEEGLDENTIGSVDFYLFDNNGNLLSITVNNAKKTSHWRSELTTATTTGTHAHDLYIGTEWKTVYDIYFENATTGFTLYAIVNLGDEYEDEANAITTLDALKALVVTDADIYKKKGELTTKELATKRFLMDGYVTLTAEQVKAWSADKHHEVSIDVKRAAAKVRINLRSNRVAGTITGKLTNYAQNTRVLTEGAPLTSTADANGNKLTLAHTTQLITYKDATLSEESNYLGSVLFYTFAHDWTEQASEETSLALNVPVNSSDNWYKLVFLPEGGSRIERNTFYEVDVTLNGDGATDSDDAILNDLNYTWKVTPWTTKGLTVDEEGAIDYLMLSTHYIDLRNEDEAELTFYSSNTVTVEVVGFDSNEAWNATDGTSPLQPAFDEGFTTYRGIPYTGVGMQAVPGVFYVDKESRRVDITQDPKASAYYGTNAVKTSSTMGSPDKESDIVHIFYDGGQKVEGNIRLYSRIPENVAPRYITLKVSMDKLYSEGTLVQYVVVEQYPLEYIVGVQGLYSYMDAAVKSKNNDGTTAYNLFFGTGNKETTDGVTQYFAYDFETYFEADNKTSPNKIIIPDEVVFGPTSKTEKTWLTSSQGSNGFGLDGHMAYGGNMKCKFFRAEDTWSNSEGSHTGMIYQIDASYHNSSYSDMPVQLMNNKEANNNNMYEVVVTATSGYHIGYPEMVNEGSETAADLKVAVSSSENNELLAPRFAFASQLGNNSAINYWEVARDQCKHYVEVGIDGTVYDNWRLPTIAELSIIKNYQLDEHVYDITMNKVVNSDGDTNPCYWTAGEDVYVNTTGAGGKETQTYSYQVTVVTYENTGYANNEANTRITKYYRMLKATWDAKDDSYKNGGYQNDLENWVLASTSVEEKKKPSDAGHEANGTYYTLSTNATPDVAVRCRCVRDIKTIKSE